MNDKEKKAVETMKHWIKYEQQHKDKIIKADELIEIQQTILDLIEKQQKEIEKKDKIIDEAKIYCERIMNYEEYEKKHSKLSREITIIAEGLTTHYKMWRVANNMNNILCGREL